MSSSNLAMLELARDLLAPRTKSNEDRDAAARIKDCVRDLTLFDIDADLEREDTALERGDDDSEFEFDRELDPEPER